jgi:hypothetical protein
VVLAELVFFPDQIRRWTSPEPDVRVVACFQCGLRVALDQEVVSLVCPFCGLTIETGAFDVAGPQTRGICTHGPVVIHTRAKYEGPKLIAGRLEVQGVLGSAYVCEELVLGRLAQLKHAGEQQALRVLPGGRVELSFPLRTVDARIGGVLEIPAFEVLGTLYLPRGGALIAKTVQAGGLIVEKGARLECDLDVSPRPRPPAPVADPLPIVETVGADASPP